MKQKHRDFSETLTNIYLKHKKCFHLKLKVQGQLQGSFLVFKDNIKNWCPFLHALCVLATYTGTLHCGNP